MAKAKTSEPTLAERASDYCRHGEEAAFYLHGLADALELLGIGKATVSHLRGHASELSMGTLYVEHGYKEK